jgi:hypothetical protein
MRSLAREYKNALLAISYAIGVPRWGLPGRSDQCQFEVRWIRSLVFPVAHPEPGFEAGS